LSKPPPAAAAATPAAAAAATPAAAAAATPAAQAAAQADNAVVAALRNPVTVPQKAARLLRSFPGALAGGAASLAAWCAQFAREVAADPRGKGRELWAAAKHEAEHYWVGSKLLWADVKIASGILGRLATGHRLTRREHMQMVGRARFRAWEAEFTPRLL
jgi:LETM1 and EF-hand domain-containing protein 1